MKKLNVVYFGYIVKLKFEIFFEKKPLNFIKLFYLKKYIIIIKKNLF